MEFSRQEYCSVLPFPPPGDFLNQGSNLGLLHFRQNLYHLSHQGRCLTEWLHFNYRDILLLKVDHNYYPAYCLFVVKFSHKVHKFKCIFLLLFLFYKMTTEKKFPTRSHLIFVYKFWKKLSYK